MSPRPYWSRVTDFGLQAYAVTANLSIALLQASYILALLGWVAGLAREGGLRKRLRLPLIVPVGAFAVWSVVATAASVEPLASLRELRSVLSVLLFYLVVNHVTRERLSRLTALLLGSAAVVSLHGLGQTVVQGANFRVHGTLPHYMTYSGVLLLNATLLLGLLVHMRRDRRALLAATALAVVLAALLMTQTRGAWLALLAGTAIVACLRHRVLLVVLPVLALVAYIAAPEPVKTRIHSLVDPNDITAHERLYMWRAGLAMVADRPWTGTGPKTVSMVYPDYKLPDDPWLPTRRFSHLHSNPVQIAAERGLPALTFWASIWLAFFVRAGGILRRLAPDDELGRGLTLGAIGAVASFLVMGLAEYNFGDSEVLTLAWFLMGVPFVVGGAVEDRGEAGGPITDARRDPSLPGQEPS
jgi:putative inorganic carbon (hco3(-)) transporter